MRALINLAILCLLTAGGLLLAIALPESRPAIEDLLISYPAASKEWITQISDTPYQWAFYLTVGLAFLLWIRPRKSSAKPVRANRIKTQPLRKRHSAERPTAGASLNLGNPTGHKATTIKLKPCTGCDSVISPMAISCPKCGHPQQTSAPVDITTAHDAGHEAKATIAKAEAATGSRGFLGHVIRAIVALFFIGLIATLVVPNITTLVIPSFQNGDEDRSRDPIKDSTRTRERSTERVLTLEEKFMQFESLCQGANWSLVNALFDQANDCLRVRQRVRDQQPALALQYRNRARAFLSDAVKAIRCSGDRKAIWIYGAGTSLECRVCEQCRDRVGFGSNPGWKRYRR